MNKTSTIILVTLLTILTICLSISLFFLIKGGFNFDFSDVKLKLIDSKEFDSIGNLDVETDTADIYIKTNSENKVKVEVYSNDYKEESITNTTNSLNVVLMKKCRIFCFAKRSKIYVYLPETYKNNMSIRSTTGDILVDDYADSDVNIKVTTGDISLKSIKNATISVTTGDVKISSVNDIIVTTTTGDIFLSKVNNYMSINTTTGDVEIGEANINKNSNIKATTGDVNIENIKNVYIDGKTTTGDNKINNNDRKSDVELTIKTTTGDIKVNY